MSWLSVLVGDRQSQKRRASSRVSALVSSPSGKRRQIELLARGREQEIALVALGFARRDRARGRRPAARARRRNGRSPAPAAPSSRAVVEQVAELDRLVALDAGHRRLAGDIALGEAVDHRFLEAVLIVEHVMRDADALGDIAGVVDILAGAAGALAMGRRAMVVELQRDADDVIALGLQQRSRRRGIDAARHGDDNPGVLRTAFEIETVEHGAGLPMRSRATSDARSDQETLLRTGNVIADGSCVAIREPFGRLPDKAARLGRKRLQGIPLI